MYNPVAQVVQVVNLEFYLFESWVLQPHRWVGHLTLFAKIKIKKDFIVESALQRGYRRNSMRVDEGRKG